MGWKVRKDRLQTESAEGEAATPTAVAPAPTAPQVPSLDEPVAFEETNESSVFDLSGTAFEDNELRFEDTSQKEEAEYQAGGAFDTLEQFLAARAEAEAAEAQAKAMPETELPFAKPPRKASKRVPREEDDAPAPVAVPEDARNGHLPAAEDAPAPLSFEQTPAPPFDLEAPAQETALSWTPPSALPGIETIADTAPEEPAVVLNRDAAAASLVSIDAQTGTPRVAPFIVDVPETASVPGAIGRLTLRVRNLSANFDLVKEVTLIGRPDTATRTYPDVEIEFDDSVSRKHGEVRKRDGKFYLVDIGSTNGVLLNGRKIAPQKEHLLTPGDRIRVGERTDLLFE